jgi:hypothetical protein
MPAAIALALNILKKKAFNLPKIIFPRQDRFVVTLLPLFARVRP